jgi:hypothetical protein
MEPGAGTEASAPGAAPKPSSAEAPAGPTAGSTAAGKSPDVNLGDELREFGKQIEALIYTARSSPRGKELEQQITSAWRDVENGINTTLAKGKSTDVKGTVVGTAAYAGTEIQGGLARGLRNLNVWMARQVEEAEERRKKRETEVTAAAAGGTADNEVADRFGGDAPVFGQGLQVPAAPIQGNPPPDPNQADNPIADRFTDNTGKS